MHTLLVILAGTLLGAVFALLGFLWGEGLPSVAAGAYAFIPVWLVLAGINTWIGVARAGYTVLEELPILGLVIAVPAGASLVLAQVLAR